MCCFIFFVYNEFKFFVKNKNLFKNRMFMLKDGLGYLVVLKKIKIDMI